MPRKESITKEMLRTKAFSLAKEQGYEDVTARKLSGYIGCSTQPIFRNYKNMDELLSDVYEEAIGYFATFCSQHRSSETVPFVGIGMAYIQFAKEEKNLFRFLFMSKVRGSKSLYELLNGDEQNISRELKSAAAGGCKDPAELFKKMWIYIHGMACMMLTDDFDIEADETKALLRDAYRKFS